MERDKNILQSVIKALQVVEVLDENGPIGIRDISKKLDIGKSTAQRLVYTLKQFGWIVEEEKSRKYMLSYRLFSIGNNVARRSSDRDMIHREIKLLAESTGENVNVGILYRDQVILIDQVESDFPIKVDARKIGTPATAYNSGLGKVFMAYQPEDFIVEQFREYPFRKTARNTIMNLSDLLADLKKVREQGYACDNEEYVDGMICYAVPIRNKQGEIPYAASISYLKYRYTDNAEGVQIILNALIETGKRLSGKLGYQQD